ncbi:eugenol synthase 1-like [Impatiens glandulifera]|uniref:eugenol synthase 1-like n=1 Tax=Impatiens glandulifera TaxID=253017 RepID=UPI001FB0F9E2|nr:eugenol synthase 1-like [Impatiens glandulifera]
MASSENEQEVQSPEKVVVRSPEQLENEIEKEKKRKVLIIGGTGYIGKFIVEASARAGHPTFALVRESSITDPNKSDLYMSFKDFGVSLIHGDIDDHESLVKAMKQVDVVICAVGKDLVAKQTKVIDAVKEAGNIQRFFPSEFGSDVERNNVVEPAKSTYAVKVNIRRAIEANNIPYTYVSSNCFGERFLSTLAQFEASTLPTEKVVILGDGTPKVVFNREIDIGTYTIKAIDDPRTLNKTLYIRPTNNIVSLNELATMWEKKIGKSLEKIYVPEKEVLENIKEADFPMKMALSLCHSAFIKGDQTNFEIESSFGVEASELYPDVKYTSVDDYLNQFAKKLLNF